MSPGTFRVLHEIKGERQAQDAKWGEQNHPDGTSEQNRGKADIHRDLTNMAAESGSLTFADILMEEVWEALAEEDQFRLREELIQVAAVAVAWVEKLDRQMATTLR